jgi:hypothetical protein
MKVANIFIAHKNAGQLWRLVRQYDPELFHNFVHIDRKSDLGAFKPILEMPSVTLVNNRWNVVWAGFGTVGATIDALRQIKKRPEKFFYYNLMSGLDFPIRPTRKFFDFLKTTYQSGPKEFFEILSLDDWPGSYRRFEQYHLIEWTLRGRYFAERLINRFISKRSFYKGRLKPFGRSAWFTASDHFIDYFLNYIDRNPDYLEFLKTVWNPDEFAFNALIMNSPFKDNIVHYLRAIDWSEGKAHPKVFRSADFQFLMESRCYIARKFDETIDKNILDSIEAAIRPDR